MLTSNTKMKSKKNLSIKLLRLSLRITSATRKTKLKVLLLASSPTNLVKEIFSSLVSRLARRNKILLIGSSNASKLRFLLITLESRRKLSTKPTKPILKNSTPTMFPFSSNLKLMVKELWSSLPYLLTRPSLMKSSKLSTRSHFSSRRLIRIAFQN